MYLCFCKSCHLFFLCFVHSGGQQTLILLKLLVSFSLDFDANNIFRAFFGGHGGGFNFDSTPGMFMSDIYIFIEMLKKLSEQVYS